MTTVQIGDLFERSITRPIPPVVYFHEQGAAELQREVEEYIITGGYNDPDPRATSEGIHELELCAPDPADARVVGCVTVSIAVATDVQPRVHIDSAEAAAQLRTFFTDERLAALGATPVQREALVAQYAGPWMYYFLRYDPSAVLARVRVPVLAMNGTLDKQVPSAENLPAIRSALAANRDVTIRELPGLNHFFQHARTGALTEYDTIAETFSPEAMGIVAEWIVTRFTRVRRGVR